MVAFIEGMEEGSDGWCMISLYVRLIFDALVFSLISMNPNEITKLSHSSQAFFSSIFMFLTLFYKLLLLFFLILNMEQLRPCLVPKNSYFVFIFIFLSIFWILEQKIWCALFDTYFYTHTHTKTTFPTYEKKKKNPTIFSIFMKLSLNSFG